MKQKIVESKDQMLTQTIKSLELSQYALLLLAENQVGAEKKKTDRALKKVVDALLIVGS